MPGSTVNRDADIPFPPQQIAYTLSQILRPGKVFTTEPSHAFSKMVAILCSKMVERRIALLNIFRSVDHLHGCTSSSSGKANFTTTLCNGSYTVQIIEQVNLFQDRKV